jgi:uncharacterized coiled-coil DUF342 family protein
VFSDEQRAELREIIAERERVIADYREMLEHAHQGKARRDALRDDLREQIAALASMSLRLEELGDPDDPTVLENVELTLLDAERLVGRAAEDVALLTRRIREQEQAVAKLRAMLDM